MLSSKQIEIFYEVYKHNSVSIAATKLGISQPSVSKTPKTIENNIGYKLFIEKVKNSFPLKKQMRYEHAKK